MNPIHDKAKESPPFSLQEGFRAAWPICLGYFPVGVAFGVLARETGLSPMQIGLMSIAVFAGSAQFIAVSMIGRTGVELSSIIATAFMINLRHVLMGSSLALYLRNMRWRFLALFAYGITDETFAVNLSHFREGCWNACQALVVNFVANLGWVVSTILGGYAGQFLPTGRFGIGYALIAMFICLLGLQLRGIIYAVTAAIAGFAAICLSLVLPGNFYVIIATVLAATAGSVLRRIFQVRNSNNV